MGDYIAVGRVCALGEMSESYLEAHVEFLKDKEVTRYLRIRNNANIEQQRKWLRETLRSQNDELLAVFAKENTRDIFIGLLQLREIDRIDGTAHVGMMIGDKRYWGRGVGGEAGLLQLKHAFDDLGLRWVYGRTASSNLRTQRLLEKVGYKKQGLRPSCRLIDGVYEDELLYGVCRKTWQPIWDSR